MEHLLLVLLSPWCSLCCFSLILFTPPFFDWHFLPCLKYVFKEALPAWLMVSAVPCSGSAGAGWNWLCRAWGRPMPLLMDDTSAGPLLPKRGHLHPIHVYTDSKMNFIKTTSTSDGDLFDNYCYGLTGSSGCWQVKWKPQGNFLLLPELNKSTENQILFSSHLELWAK